MSRQSLRSARLQVEVKPIVVKGSGFLPDLSAKGVPASSNGMELMDGEREVWAGACSYLGGSQRVQKTPSGGACNISSLHLPRQV
jgi:hypothetical protein